MKIAKIAGIDNNRIGPGLNRQENVKTAVPTFNQRNFISNVYHYTPINFKASLKEHLGQGARYLEDGSTRFTVTAPNAESVSVNVVRNNEYHNPQSYTMSKQGNQFEATVDDARPGDKYQYTVVNKSGSKFSSYDPRADYLPNDIIGYRDNSDWAEIIDHKKFQWTDENWLRNRNYQNSQGWQLPGEMIIESMHVGVLGGFQEAKKEIDRIAENKIANVVRIMPIGEFYGKHNWGYDEVAKYAVENSYGSPDDFKDFVDYAHSKNVGVILDVVLNHFGAYGNVAEKYMPIYAKDKKTPWGDALQFNGENGKHLKSYMTDMLMNWAVNYHVDGFRFDATHFMDSDATIRDINYELRSHNETKNLILYPEDMRISRAMANKNSPKEINDSNWGHSGLTTFDFYKSLIALATNAVYNDFEPDTNQLEHIFKRGILSSHEEMILHKDPRASQEYKEHCRRNLSNIAEPGSENYLINISNQDEIGNEAGGKRNLLNILSSRLNILSRCGSNWQQAQWLTFDMVKNYLQYNCPLDESVQKKYGCTKPVSKEEFAREFTTAYELNKAMIGTMFMHPSPKEFFMGDERGELAPFKFFCDMPDDAINPKTQKPFLKEIEEEKGYPPTKQAFDDSKLRQKQYNADWINKGTLEFSRDFAQLLRTSPALKKASFDNICTYSHNNKILEVKYYDKFNNETIAVINFTPNPQYSFELKTTNGIKVKEVLNSNDTTYNGNGEYNNKWKEEIYSNDLTIPPNGIVVFEKKQ